MAEHWRVKELEGKVEMIMKTLEEFDQRISALEDKDVD